MLPVPCLFIFHQIKLLNIHYFASFLTCEEPKTNKTVDVLNYNSNFALDSFEFDYFKRL